MNWLFKRRETPPVAISIRHDEVARDVIRKGQKSIDEAIIQLDEVRQRKERIAEIRRTNHLAPAIYAAFQGKSKR